MPEQNESTPDSSGIFLTDLMLTRLRQSRPWMKFLSVLGFVSCGLMVLFAVIALVMGAVTEFGGTSGIFMASVYLLMSGIYVVPSYLLFQSAGALAELERTRQAGAMELALSHQWRFWRYLGIVAIVMLGIYALMLVVLLVVLLFTLAANH